MNFEEWQENLKRQRGIETVKPERKFEVINSSKKKQSRTPVGRTPKIKSKKQSHKTRPKATTGKKVIAEQNDHSVLHSRSISENNASKKEIMGLPIITLARRYNLNLTKILEELRRYMPSITPKAKIDEKILTILLGEFDEVSDIQYNYLFQSLEDNLFDDRELKSIDFPSRCIETYFTHVEAFSICKGLDKTHANSLAKKYFANIPLTEQDFFDAHMYAMVALEKYGGQTLSLCVALPPVTFQSNKVYKAFRLLQKIDNTTPSISFFLKNPLTNNDKEQFFLTFGLKEIGKINHQIAYLRHKKSNQVVAVLKDDGTITPTDVNRLYRSQLNLFFTVLDNPRQAFVTFGNSTGTCSICGRELTRHESAIKGIGPVCEKLLA